MRLAAQRGKTVLLEFFATWCPHCAAEAPHLKSIAATLRRGHYAFLSVNADGEDPASVLAYHIYFDLPFPALLDPSSHPGNLHHPGCPGRCRWPTRSRLSHLLRDRPARQDRVVGAGEQPDALLLAELRNAAAR